MKKNNAIERFIAKQTQIQKNISSEALLEVGFLNTEKGHELANLVVYFEDKYYYYNVDGERCYLNNMFEVSNLVYGVTPFLNMHNG